MGMVCSLQASDYFVQCNYFFIYLLSCSSYSVAGTVQVDGSKTYVLKFDMHCQCNGCIKKINDGVKEISLSEGTQILLSFCI
jgi:hypothetical protein